VGQDAAAVSPVIGSVLILVITILGIAGVLYWGAPMIERIQVQNAQVAMVGEFEDIRDSSRELSVPDHSRFPTIVVPRGQVSITPGSRVMVTVDTAGSANTGCDFHITDWADTTTKGSATATLTGCQTGSPNLVQVYAVSGATLSQVSSTTAAASMTLTPSPAIDFSKGDWMFRLTNGQATPTVYAQAWLHSGDDVAWSTDSATGKRSVTFDAGAIFSQTAGTVFLEKPGAIGDAPFGSTYYGLWLRSLTAQSYGSVTGAGSHQVYLSLIGNYDRVDTVTPQAYRLRYDVSGSLAQSWCNALLSRNSQISSQVPPALYTSQGSSCAQITTDGVRSVCYEKVSTLTGANACTTAPSTAFTFRFLHARIYTSLAV
jgi:hypothetical protein